MHRGLVLCVALAAVTEKIGCYVGGATGETVFSYGGMQNLSDSIHGLPGLNQIFHCIGPIHCIDQCHGGRSHTRRLLRQFTSHDISSSSIPVFQNSCIGQLGQQKVSPGRVLVRIKAANKQCCTAARGERTADASCRIWRVKDNAQTLLSIASSAST